MHPAKNHINMNHRAGSFIWYVIPQVVFPIFTGFFHIRRDVGNNWQSGFSKRTRKELRTILDKRDLNDEGRIEIIRKWLGGKDVEEWKDRGKRDCPFLWESVFEENWDGKAKERLYLSPILISVFAVHFEVARGPEKHDFCDTPSGALVLAIQAVQHALEYSVDTGTFSAPQDLGNFSGQNWGNVEIEDPTPGGPTHHAYALRHLLNVEKIPASYWPNIVNAAKAVANKRLRGKRKHNAKNAQKPKGPIYDLGDDPSPLFDPEWETTENGAEE
ncbi:hypothetical protein AN958_02514 [Leucoagaricus sp. SymC.cos]|nr:hypothetical protein AN958_02514 [Leucoagaricus sp. SymC.cos]